MGIQFTSKVTTWCLANFFCKGASSWLRMGSFYRNRPYLLLQTAE